MLLASPLLAQDYLPLDIQRFVDRRAGCETNRDPHGACAATAKELVQLKRKYAANSTIMQVLHQFDLRIDTAGIVDVPAPAPASAPKKRKPRRAG